MDLKTLECPKCGSEVDVENGLDTFYCKYCGAKIQMDGLSPEAYDARVQIKQLEHKERVLDRHLDQERYKIESRRKDDRRKLLSKIFSKNGVVGFVVAILVVMGAWMIVSAINSHTSIRNNLVKTEQEVVQAIQDNDFVTARLKVNQLRISDNWSAEEERGWNTKRTEYIRLIDEKETEYELKNPDNIFMPADSSYYTGKNYVEVLSALRDLGFENATAQESISKVDWFHSANTVESMIIGGKTSFKKGDYFHKDSVVIIYYYGN